MIFQLGNIVNPIEILDPSGRSRGFNDPTGGIITFGSGLLRLIVIGAGILALFNFIMAGIEYMTSENDAAKLQAATNKIFVSVMGLAIIAIAFILSAVIGLLFYNEPLIFIRPSVYAPS